MGSACASHKLRVAQGAQFFQRFQESHADVQIFQLLLTGRLGVTTCMPLVCENMRLELFLASKEQRPTFMAVSERVTCEPLTG